MTETACMDCGLAGWGVARIPWAEIPKWRKAPGPALGLSPASHLKLADDQTVIACAAMLNACERAGWSPTKFGAWSILAASTYIGRARLVPAMRRFQQNGPRSISPLIIPTLSNHAVAGTLCLIFRSHGANFGVGGSTPMVDEILLNAVSLCDGQQAPGIWAVITAFNPELVPNEDGHSITPAVGVGVALALVPEASRGSVRIVTRGPVRPHADVHGTVFELADFLEQAANGSTWRCPINGGGSLELVNSLALPLRQAG